MHPPTEAPFPSCSTPTELIVSFLCRMAKGCGLPFSAVGVYLPLRSLLKASSYAKSWWHRRKMKP
jgi:hypothetical protein